MAVASTRRVPQVRMLTVWQATPSVLWTFDQERMERIVLRTGAQHPVLEPKDLNVI